MRTRRPVAAVVAAALASAGVLVAAAPGVALPLTPWPGGTAVSTVDGVAFGQNLSGLAYQGSGGAAAGTIWAVKNNPSTLYRLTKTGNLWVPGNTYSLLYPGGTGVPDAEGVALTDAGPAGGVYVATERNDDGANSSTSRMSVLRYLPSGPDGALSAATEWNLTPDLPVAGANLGLEAITWVPDSYLTATGFVDQSTGLAYAPGGYPLHGSGLFVVGVEASGLLYAYALNSDGTFHKVAEINDNTFVSVMDLTWDPDRQKLWVVCDNTCDGKTLLMGVQAGAFKTETVFSRPGGMGNFNNEGFTVAPNRECSSGTKPAFWADDADDDGHALRAGTIGCDSAVQLRASATSAAPRSAAGWYRTPVTVSFTCSVGALPLSGGCPAPVTLATSGVDQSVTRTVSDTGGGTVTATVSDLDLDLVKPTVKIKGAKKGRTYPHKLKPKCTAKDSLSGVASCKVKQKKKGSKYVVTATATDKAGNVASTKLTYKVKPTRK